MKRPDAKEFIEGRMKKYKNFIDQLGSEMITEWNNGDYRAAGMYDGEIAQYMGLVPNPYNALESIDDMDPEAPAQFIAGWLYGISW